jgi:hypothetical protein
MSSPDGGKLVGGEELDPLKREISLPDLVFQDTPPFAGGMLEEGHFPALHQDIFVIVGLNQIGFYNIEQHFFPMKHRGKKDRILVIDKATNRLAAKGVGHHGCE